MSDVFGKVLPMLFTNGLAVDIALGFIALEFVFLLLRAPIKERRTAVFNLVLALGPGVCLMIALRCALTQSGIMWIAIWLILSLPLHIGDVLRRKF